MIAIRKLLSAVAAASLLATGSMAGAASLGGAQTLPTAAAQVAAVDGIPGTGNLHVHKRIGMPSEAEGVTSDGREVAESLVPGAPAEGITFYAHQVQALNNPQDWVNAQGLDPEAAMESVDLDDPFRSLSTNDEGVASFMNLPRGLYLVVEEDNPVTEAGQATAPVAPFLVAVPLTDPAERQTWLEDVYVYPKNQAVESVTKTITDPTPDDDLSTVGSTVGDLIGYSISGIVPEAPEGALSGFSITDKLPAGLGAPQDVTVTINGTTAEDTNYEVDTWIVEEDGAERNVLLVQLTEAGIASAGLDGAGAVTVDFNAEVVTPPQGTLDNLAWISPTNLAGAGSETSWNPGVDGPNPGTASNATRSIYGEITIIKTGQGEGAPRLPNAIFELHRCTAGETDTEGTLVEDSEAIAVGGETAWRTGEGGTVSISGIHLANVQDQDNLADTYTDLWEDNGDQFCLVETQAPDEYELLPAPVIVPMAYTAGTTGLVDTDSEIQNVRANFGSQLPLTGGIGIWVILGIGVLLLLAAAAYYLANRKRDA